MTSAFVKDTHEESLRWANINGKLTEVTTNTDSRGVTIKLVPGEGDVPERETWYDSGKSFIPRRLTFSWTRRNGGKWVRERTSLEGPGFAKDGKTALKGRGRRDDGSLGFNHPTVAGQDPEDLPESLNRPWIVALIDSYHPDKGWPQEVIEGPEDAVAS